MKEIQKEKLRITKKKVYEAKVIPIQMATQKIYNFAKRNKRKTI